MDPEFPIRAGLWLCIFPVTYILHFAEEYWVAGGYVEYLYRLRGVRVSRSRFVMFQAGGLVMFMVPLALWLAGSYPYYGLLFLSGFIFCNGVTHTRTAIRHRGYGPGTVMSIVWLLLGVATTYLLYEQIAFLPWIVSVGLGLAFNLVVGVVTMLGGRFSRRLSQETAESR